MVHEYGNFQRANNVRWLNGCVVWLRAGLFFIFTWPQGAVDCKNGLKYKAGILALESQWYRIMCVHMIHMFVSCLVLPLTLELKDCIIVKILIITCIIDLWLTTFDKHMKEKSKTFMSYLKHLSLAYWNSVCEQKNLNSRSFQRIYV